MPPPLSARMAAERAIVRDRRHAPAQEEALPAPDTTAESPGAMLLRLQREAGNDAVVQLLRAPTSPVAGLLRASGRAAVQRSSSDEDDEEDGGFGTAVEEPGTESLPAAEGDVADGSAGGGGTDGGGAGGAGGGGWWPFGSDTDPSGGGGGGGGDAGGGGGGEGGWLPELPDIPNPFAGGGDAGGGSSWLPDMPELPDMPWLPDVPELPDIPNPFASDDGGGGDGPTSDDGGNEDSDAERDGKAAEGEGMSQTAAMVPMGGGAPPYAPAAGAAPTTAAGASATAPVGATPAIRFVDAGRVGTVPFGESASCLLADAPDHPHAFTAGGGSGAVAWSGGGPAGGPKGNQGTGSLQGQVPAVYDSRSNGLISNADAWVRPGTGTVDVTRSYSTSAAGDQGNGWWISPAAASFLEAHEQRHVSAAKEVYNSTIGSMADRVARSDSYGKGVYYRSANAITYVANYVGWEKTLGSFKEQDAQWNANQGEVDQRDLGSGYPRNQKGPRTIAGKVYQNYLVKPGEEPPA